MRKTNTFNEILLRRRNKLNISVKTENIDMIGHVMIMMKNINVLGYTFSKELIEVLRYMSSNKLNELYKELIGCLKEYRGADKEWNPMYPNFPEQVEKADDWELFINAIIHYISGGILAPDYEKDERLPLFESPDLTVLDLGTNEDLDEIMNNLITSKTSLSETDKDDMITLIRTNGLNIDKLPDTIFYKENVAIICKLIMDNTSELVWYKVLHKYLKTATDILRFVTYLSDGDISLAEKTDYKSLPNKQRYLIMKLLDNAGNIEEDMLRHKSKWINVGEMIHPGEAKYSRFNKAVIAFDKLRNNGKIETFGGKVDKALDEGRLFDALELLKNRPGELARCLDYLLRRFDSAVSQMKTIETFKNVADKISVPVLLQVREHFAYRNDGNDSRVFFIKGQTQKIYTIKNELPEITDILCNSIVGICEEAIINQFKLDVEEGRKEPLGKVYIDDSIKGFCIPQSQRSASATGMKNITRCSRFGINKDANFIRLGIHWCNEVLKDYHGNDYEQRTDIDLSCSFLDENFGYIDHISYTHLRNGYCWHSGDFVTAPRDRGGSAEFIDISIDKALNTGVKYAAVQVYGYTQTKFCDLDDMLFNWQEGIEQDCGDIFEPSRVQHCVNLGCNTYCEIPVIFDLEKREVVWCDLALTTRTSFPRCVENNIRGLSATAMGICQSHKPQMYDLGVMNAKARGVIVNNRNDADIIISNDLTKPIEKIKVEVRNEQGELIETKIEEIEKDVKFITVWDTDTWMSEML